jgi:PAS domain-containing protein
MLLCTNRANAILENADHSLMTAIQAAQRSYVISDPALPDNPIIFASKGFLDLSGYTLENTLGRNCRFLQGNNIISK